MEATFYMQLLIAGLTGLVAILIVIVGFFVKRALDAISINTSAIGDLSTNITLLTHRMEQVEKKRK